MAIQQRQAAGTVGESGLSPEAQQLLIYMGLGCLAAFVVVRVVYTLLYMLPMVAVAMFFSKPSLYGFRDFLAIVEKKDGSEGEDSSVGAGGGGWLASLVTKGIKGIKGAIFNPAHAWVYLDMLVLVLAKKKGQRKYAVGLFNRWIMLEETSTPPFLYGFIAADMAVGWLGEEQWAPFAALPPPPAGSTDAARSASLVPPIDPTRLLNAANEILGSELDAMAARAGTPQSASGRGRRASSPSEQADGGRRVGGERPIRQYLDRAQRLAEAGSFEQAGHCVEQGLSRCRGSLRAGGEEELELWLVAAAFYEASGSSLTSYVKCVREGADLCVSLERWARAAQLFEQAAEAWSKEKEDGSNYAIIATSKSASLVLAAVLCLLVFGDVVKAEEVFRRARVRDREVVETPEGELAESVLTACSHYDSQLLRQARTSYVNRGGQSTPLEPWQEAALQQVAKRLDSGQLK